MTPPTKPPERMARKISPKHLLTTTEFTQLNTSPCYAPTHSPRHSQLLTTSTARPPPTGDGSCHERGPQHTRLLVSHCAHWCTKKPRALRLSAAVTLTQSSAYKASRSPLSYLYLNACFYPPAEVMRSPHSCIQAGERALGIAILR